MADITETTFTLSPKIRKFIRFYDGDLVASMRNAGFNGNDNQLNAYGKNLLAQPAVQEGIRQQAQMRLKEVKLIADKEEIQAYLTNTMRNEDPNFTPYRDKDGILIETENIPQTQRLKSAELLGKSQGMYTENINVSGSVDVMNVIRETYTLDSSEEDLDAIEAEYERVASNKKSLEMSGTTNDPFGGLV